MPDIRLFKHSKRLIVVPNIPGDERKFCFNRDAIDGLESAFDEDIVHLL